MVELPSSTGVTDACKYVSLDPEHFHELTLYRIFILFTEVLFEVVTVLIRD